MGNRRIHAESSSGIQLVSYDPVGEKRIENRGNMTCSDWLYSAEYEYFEADPERMDHANLDGPLDDWEFEKEGQ